MSIAKEYIFEKEKEGFDNRLASLLGISTYELDQTEYEVDSNEGYDGATYGYFIKFKDDSPQEILDKISGLDSNNLVWLNIWELEDSGADDYDEYDYEIGSIDYNSYIDYNHSSGLL